jgi:hypothetical protein
VFLVLSVMDSLSLIVSICFLRAIFSPIGCSSCTLFFYCYLSSHTTAAVPSNHFLNRNGRSLLAYAEPNLGLLLQDTLFAKAACRFFPALSTSYMRLDLSCLHALGLPPTTSLHVSYFLSRTLSSITTLNFCCCISL